MLIDSKSDGVIELRDRYPSYIVCIETRTPELVENLNFSCDRNLDMTWLSLKAIQTPLAWGERLTLEDCAVRTVPFLRRTLSPLCSCRGGPERTAKGYSCEVLAGVLDLKGAFRGYS